MRSKSEFKLERISHIEYNLAHLPLGNNSKRVQELKESLEHELGILNGTIVEEEIEDEEE